jgi:hypothetical protein
MNRAQALAIFSTMDDDHLFKALEAVGVPSGAQEGGGMMEEPGLESWNSREVSLGSGHGGMLLDRTRFATQMPMSQRRQNPEPDYKKFSPAGYEDWQANDPGAYT